MFLLLGKSVNRKVNKIYIERNIYRKVATPCVSYECLGRFVIRQVLYDWFVCNISDHLKVLLLTIQDKSLRYNSIIITCRVVKKKHFIFQYIWGYIKRKFMVITLKILSNTINNLRQNVNAPCVRKHFF